MLQLSPGSLGTSTQAFWGTGQKGERVFVALDENVQDAQLKAGDQVSVAGRVMKVPQDKSEIDKNKWGLNDEDLNNLSSDSVFVRAKALGTGQHAQQQQ